MRIISRIGTLLAVAVVCDVWAVTLQSENFGTVDPVAFKVFFKGQTNAALRGSIRSTVPCEYVVSGLIEGLKLDDVRVRATRDETCFALPFDSTLAIGRHPYSVRVVKCAENRVVYDESGEIEMREPQDKSSWKIFDWGGHKQPPNDFLKLIGISVANVRVDGPENVKRRRRQIARAAELVEAGFLVNIRHENAEVWKRLGYDDTAIAEEVRRDLRPFEGLDPWVMTLLNTETYGLKVFESATNAPCFLSAATKALGKDVDWNFQAHPLQLPFEDARAVAAGLKGFRGVVKRGNPALETLKWFAGYGVPAYHITTVTAAEVKGINPDGLVWTEPIAGPGQAEGVDMLADWIYKYGVRNRIALQYQQYGRVRALARPIKFMPTISPLLLPGGLNMDGQAVLDPSVRNRCPTASALEMMTYSWIALGATRSDALSIWNLGAWYYDEHDDAAPARYGEFIRKQFKPIAEKLKGLENVRAPLAVLAPSLPSVAAGGARFSSWHCYRQQLMLIAQGTSIPFDVLYDAEINAKTLEKYKVVYLPWSFCLYEEQVAALAKVSAEGTKVVTDAPGEWLGRYCRSFECLKNVRYKDPKDTTTLLPLKEWAKCTGQSLRGNLFAWSDRDDEPAGSLTFVKQGSRRKFALVVNVADCPLEITTHFRNGCPKRATYAPAEARVYEL